MQCKIFSGTRIPTLESRINEWLEESKPKVNFIVQSESPGEESMGGEKVSGVTISIFYEKS